MGKISRQLRRVLAAFFFYASLICLLVSHFVDPETGAMGIEALQYGTHNAGRAGDQLQPDHCARRHEGPFVRMPDGRSQCAACKAILDQ